MTDDPLEIFRELFERAVESCVEPDAMVLSTVDADGRPSGRYVLRQAFDEPGFVFYTNIESRKARALAVLAARIKDKQIRDQQQKTAATRKSLIGSGDRSERIRTYNFPQGRVTDHRINLTLYKIGAIMDGDLSELTSALSAEHQTEQLSQLGEEAAA